MTDKGIAMLEQYVAAVRDAVGMEIPLSMDHLGHLGVKSIIRLGKAYEKYNLVVDGRCNSMDLHRSAQADCRREPHAHSDRRRYLFEGAVPGSLSRNMPLARFSRISPPLAEFWKLTKSAIWPRNTAFPWPCISPERP